ncbi:Embryonic Polyadenylate-Binding Protein 2 [Manis pentadactyla]|nr:Embryonic Polyadenylate-Binding Protein 2 [Manis pentadactyla]
MAYSEKRHRKGQCGGRPVPTPGGWREPQGWRVSSLSPEQGDLVFPLQSSEAGWRGQAQSSWLLAWAQHCGVPPATWRRREGPRPEALRAPHPHRKQGPDHRVSGKGHSCTSSSPGRALPSRHSIPSEARRGAQKRKEQRGFLEAAARWQERPLESHTALALPGLGSAVPSTQAILGPPGPAQIPPPPGRRLWAHVPSFPLLHAQELQATRLKLWAMEQAQGRAGAEEGTRAEAALTRQLLSPETGCLCPGTPTEKVEADHRSVYVGNVDYGGTAEELEAYFSHCGEVHRVTILCDKFSGRPKGYAYVEFAAQSSAQAAVGLDSSIFRGRVIKVLPKRTNLPGISSTDRGGLRGHPGTRAGPFPGRSLHGHVEVSPWRSPYWRAGRLWGWVRSKPRCSTRAAYVARSCRSLAVAQTPRREPRSTSQRAGHGAAPGGSEEPWATPGSSGSARAWPSQGCPTKNF